MSRWPIHSCRVRIGTLAAAIAVPNVWRRSWKRCASSSFAALSALRIRRNTAALSSGPPPRGSQNTSASPAGSSHGRQPYALARIPPRPLAAQPLGEAEDRREDPDVVANRLGADAAVLQLRHEVHHVLVREGADRALPEVGLKVNAQGRLHGRDRR